MAPDGRESGQGFAKEKVARPKSGWRKKNVSQQSATVASIKSVHAVILGKDGVGKSALAVRLLTRRFIGEYDSNLESVYGHCMQVDDNCISLDIMDTAGENHDSKLQQCALFGNLFIILYSITDASSFREAKQIGRFIKRLKSSVEYTFVVVATKRDLHNYRKVYQDEGKTLAHELNGYFYEISSAEGFEETQTMIHDTLRLHLQQKTNARDRVEARGLMKMTEELLVKTKSLYRKRGMTF